MTGDGFGLTCIKVMRGLTFLGLMLARKCGAKSRTSKQIAARFAGLLLSCALLSGLTHANARYFYCEAMGLLSVDPCATAVSSKAQGVPSVAELRPHHFDCCEVITLPSLPASTTISTIAVPPAGCVATLPATALIDVAHLRLSRAATDVERERRPPRSAAHARAQLMVFLT